jgi:hypothetical protein
MSLSQPAINFQAESTISGDDFEDKVLVDLSLLGYKNIQQHVVIPEVGVEADFAFTHYDQQVYVEAKGGYQGEGKRPGAKRTDNVKKAIANAALVKSEFPDCKYVIYFSDTPVYGKSSYKMIKAAIKAGFVDQVIYLVSVL